MRAGSRYESRRNNGLSHLFEHMLFRGTERHPSAFALNHAIESLGATLEGATHVDFVTYSLALPRPTILDGIDRLGEIVRSPLYLDLEVEQKILEEELLEGLDEDGRDIDVDVVSREQLFPEHALGYKITGPLSNVKGFTVDDLRAHHEAFYGANNLVLAVAGAVDAAAVLDRAAEALGELRSGERVVATPHEATRTEPFAYVRDEGSQTELRLSYRTFGLRHPDAMALMLLGRVLDDGMSTRVHRRIVDERGLAYDVFAGEDPYEDCGVFDFGVAVAHGKAPEVLEELGEIAASLREDEVCDEELDKARRRYLWDLEATLDDAEGLAEHYGTTALFELGETLDDLAAQARAVTKEQLRDVARAVLRPEDAHVAAVGMLDRELEKRTRRVVDELRG